jgi:hypothetical protein
MGTTRERVFLMGVCQAWVGVLVAFGLPLSTRQIGVVLVATGALLFVISRQVVRSPSTSPAPALVASPGAGPAAGGPWSVTIDETLAPRCTSRGGGLA